MIETLKKAVLDCLTGIDCKTFDAGRVYLAGAVLTFLAGAIVIIIKTHALDFQAFGIGFGALLAGGGLGIAAKAKTEPGGSA